MSIIDEHLKNVSPGQKQQLDRVRAVAKQMAPDAEETISYGVPALKYKGQYLIGFAAYQNHLSIFPTPGPIAALKDKLGDFQVSKGAVQFTIEHPIPEPLLKQIIEIRLRTIAEE